MQTCQDNFDLQHIVNINDVDIRYKLIKYLGRGASGFVYSIFDNTTKEVVALKIIIYNEDDFGSSLDEIRIGCLLSQLENYTDCFIPIYQWWISRNPPFNLNPWNVDQNEEEYIDQDILYVNYTMLLADDNLSNLPLKEITDLPGLVFEIIYSYYLVNQLYGFIHQDISSKNILYRRSSFDRIYPIKGKNYFILSPIQIYFSDYETVILTNPKSPYYVKIDEDDLLQSQDTDIFYLIELISYLLGDNSSWQEFILQLRKTSIKNWLELIERSPLFENLRQPVDLSGRVVKIYQQYIN